MSKSEPGNEPERKAMKQQNNNKRLSIPVPCRQWFMPAARNGAFCVLWAIIRRKGYYYMYTEKNTATTVKETEQPDLVRKIGKTTYKVKVHFSTTSKETMSDKIIRMLRNEVRQM